MWVRLDNKSGLQLPRDLRHYSTDLRYVALVRIDRYTGARIVMLVGR
jgi:hypothetical protein